MRKSLAWLCTLAIAWLPCQGQVHPGLQLGMGTGYAYGFELPQVPGIEAYAPTRTGGFCFDGYIGIPIGRLALYPSYIYTIPTRSMTVRNLQGDFVPAGYSLSLPESQQNPGVIYGDTYYDLSARAEIWQRQLGSYVLLHLGGGVEIGSGIFHSRRSVITHKQLLVDEYWYSGTANGEDHYAYGDTYTEGIETDKWVSGSVSVPLVLQWRYQGDYVYTGTSIVRWLGGGDAYWMFRYSVGLNF